MTSDEAHIIVKQIRELVLTKQLRDAYRLIALEAVVRLHQVARERDRYRARLHHLLDERRTAA